jgi:hypothetical protein
MMQKIEERRRYCEKVLQEMVKRCLEDVDLRSHVLNTKIIEIEKLELKLAKKKKLNCRREQPKNLKLADGRRHMERQEAESLKS